ncbi:uncharacterized protein TNCV_4850001 [Trichonephila clavipes]|nr:uncharacterized protein TNCV_4850001 [Trichonephila clavipes]
MYHTSRDSVEILTEFFVDRVISKGLWPPRSPDLRTCIPGGFLWGYLKHFAFRNNPHTLKDLKSNVIPAISDINSHTYRKVSINLVKKVRLCALENGYHFEHLL